jgi:hypothetical protein|tara:strand:- start:2128 stop:4656 length:2529 start_codon:yes stop_codon:yes gene_type:complete
MATKSLDGIIKEKSNAFAGKDGFFWWVGEIEDNADPMNLGRVKCRVLHYYTNPNGGSAEGLPTEEIPWATVLQHTSQAGNDGQGESSGQLQPGAIVMGFFMDGESAQMPIVMGVLRMNKGDADEKRKFVLTGEEIPKDLAPNPASSEFGATDSTADYAAPTDNNSVKVPSDGQVPGAGGAPSNLGNVSGISGSSANAQKPRNAQVPAANGVKGPMGTLMTGLQYLVEDIATTAGNLTKNEEGDFIDIVEGKLITFETLTAKLRNFLSGVFAQVVAAIREGIEAQIETLQTVIDGVGFLGIPGPTLTAVQKLIAAILDKLCGIDDQLIDFILDPIGALADIIDQVLDQVISTVEAAISSFEKLLDSILCYVQDLIETLQTIIDLIKTATELADAAKTALEAVESGEGIMAEASAANPTAMNLTSILGFLTALIGLIPDQQCGRRPSGGDKNMGWYPFFGMTACGPELDNDGFGEVDIGKALGNCGTDKMGTSFLDGIMECAVPYMTQATNYLSGAYDLNIGTPGKQATIKKTASGSTDISVKTNQKVAAEARARAELKAQGVTDPDKVEKEVEKYVKKNTPKSKKKGKSGEQDDTASFVADHSIKAGNFTQETHGDDCKTVDSTYAITVGEDYRLKVAGDFHLEVGGGFFIHAAGGPKITTDEKGKDTSDNSKPQKHTMLFGSDLEVKVQGAGLALHASEYTLSANTHKIQGGNYNNVCGVQEHSGGEHVFSGGMFNVGASGVQFNVNPTSLPTTVGFNVNCGGPVTFTQFGTTPLFTIANPLGAVVTNSLSWSTDTQTAITLTAKGAITASAALALTLDAGAAMTLTAKAAMVLTAPTIKLN